MIGPLSAWAAVAVALGTTAFMAWLARRNRRVLRLELDPWAEELERMVREVRDAEEREVGDPGPV